MRAPRHDEEEEEEEEEAPVTKRTLLSKIVVTCSITLLVSLSYLSVLSYDYNYSYQQYYVNFLKSLTRTCTITSTGVPNYSSSNISHNNRRSKKRVLNIHIVPHTHDDVGWLKTVEQYYYGSNHTIQNACVSCILDTVIDALQAKPHRKFTYVEMAFFTMWYEQQSIDTKHIVKNLVANGQLSFANGGWCMHDEATTHFMGMIDQTTLGHLFLHKEFNYTPRVGWQLDPFGHSSTQASLLGSDTGFNALFFGRIDHQDLQQRQETRNCEGIWNPSSSSSLASNRDDNGIFFGLTGSYLGNYGAFPGFCFDILCNDEPLVGLNNETRLYERMVTFMTYVNVQVNRTRGDNIMLTMGSDFQYSDAYMNFENLDLLISIIHKINRNSNSIYSSLLPSGYDKIHAFYSTPEMYTNYKYNEFIQHKEEQLDEMNFETKYDDFFPYSDCDQHCFWTGYFTSRPALKRLERVGSSFLQVARQVQSFFSNGTTYGFHEIYELENAMGIVQHHDGVSGTSKQHVAYDYAKKVQFGIDQATSFVTDVMKDTFANVVDMSEIAYCQLRNESICEISQDATRTNAFEPFYVVLYNSIAHERNELVSLPVSSNATYKVEKYLINVNNKDLSPRWDIVENSLVPNVSGSDKKVDNRAPFILWFDPGSVLPISMTLFRISIVKSGLKNEISMHNKKLFTVRNDKLDVHFDNGKMKGITNANGFNISLHKQWGYYKSFQGNSIDKQASGAYIFRPEIPNATYHVLSPDPSKTMIIETPLLTEVHVGYEVPWLQEVIILYKHKRYIDFHFTVGPIDISDGVGKEVVSRFETDIQNDGTFYTDSNGREFIKRIRSARNTWELQEFEPIAGNYYPVNTAIYIEDNKTSIAVLTDRSQGGSSLADGKVELMVHRRTIQDDLRGVGEPINETDEGIMPYPPFGDASRKGKGITITGKHRILISDGKRAAELARSEMDNMFAPLQVFAARSKNLHSTQPPLKIPSSSALTEALPKNIQLITIQLLSFTNGYSNFLLRLGHSYGLGESQSLSLPVTVSVSNILVDYNIVSLQETTLTGNTLKSDWMKEKFRWSSNEHSQGILTKFEENRDGKNFTVVLHPMEIKTFRIYARKVM